MTIVNKPFSIYSNFRIEKKIFPDFSVMLIYSAYTWDFPIKKSINVQPTHHTSHHDTGWVVIHFNI